MFRCFILIIVALLLSANAEDKNVHSFAVKDIDGKAFNMVSLKGKTLLIVNVASNCGLTSQYTQLQALHKKYSSKGLVVMAFPANNFRQQEPGSNKQIKQFCQSRYGVQFSLMSKIDVKGSKKSKLYQYLTQHKKFGGEISWNFEKFLVDSHGNIVQRFKPQIKPDASRVIKAIEAQLK